jgi:hypothetical protein
LRSLMEALASAAPMMVGDMVDAARFSKLSTR